MITLNHKVSHEVTGFWRKLGESFGVIGEVGGSPYKLVMPCRQNAHSAWALMIGSIIIPWPAVVRGMLRQPL